MNFSLNNKLLSLTLTRVNAWISYPRKEVNYYIKNCIHYMKPLLESNLLYFVTRFYKNLEKPVRNFSCLHVFNIFPACASFPPNENTGQNTKSGMYKRLGPLLLLCLLPPHTKRLCDNCCDLHLTLMFSVKGRWSWKESFFPTNLLSCLSQKISRLLLSPVLLHKFTIVIQTTLMWC